MAARRHGWPGYLFLLAFPLAPPALAQSAEFVRNCTERLPAPTLRVQHRQSGYSIDSRLSYRDLTGMGAGLLRHGKQNVLGITRAETTATVEIQMARLEEEASGRACLSPQVLVTIAYKPIQVYIGREFPPGGCAYKEILLHEMRHVRAYQYFLPRVEAGVRSLLARHFQARILYGQPAAVEATLTAEVYDKWLPLVDAEIRKVDAAQAEIDSAEEYDRMEGVCDGEVQRTINGGQ